MMRPLFLTLLHLNLRSLWNRKATAGLTMLTIALSVTLILGVETVRQQARDSFTQTVSGTDLLVGARSGSLPLLLYSVFHIGNATNNIDWRSYQEISRHPAVAWSIPISLGDSHRGYRVVGTTLDYFRHYHYGNGQSLRFSTGQPFDGVYDAVLGAEVARALGYQVGEKIVLAHGVDDTHFSRHDDKPFTVVGILAPTGTPVDRSILISLEGIEALHVDWQSGTRARKGVTAEEALKMDLQPKQITAFMLGLKKRTALFRLQRAINNYRKEPLLAILPGIALAELWQLTGVAEKALLAVSGLVLLNSLIGLMTVILTSLNERRRELAILRSVGARPGHILLLLTLESLATTLIGCLLGMVCYYLALIAAAPFLQGWGLYIAPGLPDLQLLGLVGGLLVVSLITGLVPGYRAYRMSLADGMTVRT